MHCSHGRAPTNGCASASASGSLRAGRANPSKASAELGIEGWPGTCALHPGAQRPVPEALVDDAVRVQQGGHVGEAALRDDGDICPGEVRPSLNLVGIQMQRHVPPLVPVEVRPVVLPFQGAEDVDVCARKMPRKSVREHEVIRVVGPPRHPVHQGVLVNVAPPDMYSDRRAAGLEAQGHGADQRLGPQRAQEVWRKVAVDRAVALVLAPDPEVLRKDPPDVNQAGYSCVRVHCVVNDRPVQIVLVHELPAETRHHVSAAHEECAHIDAQKGAGHRAHVHAVPLVALGAADQASEIPSVPGCERRGVQDALRCAARPVSLLLREQHWSRDVAWKHAGLATAAPDFAPEAVRRAHASPVHVALCLLE
mmetsp:Transcript_90261/g.250848  ORF Transcript_90261/g.250848 Transcript_90261/m.250848 type:complete len:366 (+) Transcript_90261:104-1201(+)